MNPFADKPSLAAWETGENSWRAALAKDPEVAFWPIVIITAIVILWLAEQGSQNCTNGKCHQIGESCSKLDDTSEIFRKLDDSLDRHWSFVPWRISALTAIFAGIIILGIFWKGFPNGILAFLTIAFIFVGVYFMFNFACANDLKPKTDKHRKLLKALQSKTRS